MKSTKTPKNRLLTNELQLKLMIQSVPAIQLKVLLVSKTSCRCMCIAVVKQLQLNLIWVIVEFEVEVEVELELELERMNVVQCRSFQPAR